MLDHDPETDRSLIVCGKDGLDRGGDLVLLTGLGQGEPKELFRRAPPRDENAGAPIEWGVTLDGDYALAKLDEKLYCWNFATGENLYTIGELGKHQPTLSPGRRYLVVPMTGETRGAAVVDPLNGDQLDFMPTPNWRWEPEVVCHPDGRQIGLTAGAELVAFDVTAKKVTVEAAFCHMLLGKPIGWTTDTLFVDNVGGLFRTDAPIIYWTFDLRSSALAIARPGGILVATKRDVCHVASLPVSTPAIEKAAQQLAKLRPKLLALRPGAEVALAAEVPQGVDKDEVLASMKQAFQESEWKISSKAVTTLVAVVGRGQPRRMPFVRQTPKPFVREIEAATITPFTVRMEIRREGQVIWTRETANYLPPLFILKDGQTVEQATTPFERPNAEFFSDLRLPASIPRSEVAIGLGVSSMDGTTWKETPIPRLPDSGPAKSKTPDRRKKKR